VYVRALEHALVCARDLKTYVVAPTKRRNMLWLRLRRQPLVPWSVRSAGRQVNARLFKHLSTRQREETMQCAWSRFMNKRASASGANARAHTHTHSHPRKYAPTHPRMHPRTHARTNTPTHACARARTHTHTHTRTRTRTRTVRRV